MIIVLMGVCGCGKTTVGRTLAAQIGAVFAEGDTFHPPSNVAKMEAGTPLTDDDRLPWLRAIGEALDGWVAKGATVVLACSALRERYRTLLAEGRSGVRFVHLKGDRALIAGRLAARQGHYMPPSLLPSQLATLEEPADALVVDIGAEPEAIVHSIRDALRI